MSRTAPAKVASGRGSDLPAAADNGAATLKVPAHLKESVEQIKAVTGAPEEEILHTLKECNFDVNETTNKLIDCPFEAVSKKGKGKKKEGGAKAQPKAAPIETKRPASAQSQKPRSQYGVSNRVPGGPSGGKPFAASAQNGFGSRPVSAGAPPLPAGGPPVPPGPRPPQQQAFRGAPPRQPAPQVPSAAPADTRPLYNRVPASNSAPQSTPAAPPAPIARPSWGTGTAGRSIADVLRGNTGPPPTSQSFPPTTPSPSTEPVMQAAQPPAEEPSQIPSQEPSTTTTQQQPRLPTANNSYMRSSYTPAQPPKEPVKENAWAAKPLQATAPAPTASGASFTSQAPVENGFPADNVASKLADLSVSEPPGMGMDEFGGDFGAGFGDTFGAGFDSENEPAQTSAPSLSSGPSAMPSGMDNAAGSFKPKAPAGFQSTPQYTYSQPTPPSVAPPPMPPTPSEQPPVPEGAPPEKPSTLSAPLPDAPPPSDVPATQQHAMPAYYGNMPGGMQPYSFIGIPGMPGAPGYGPPYDQGDQSSDGYRMGSMQYPGDAAARGSEEDKSATSSKAGLLSEGSSGAPFPPSGPPPSTRATSTSAPPASSAQAARPPPPAQAFTGMPHAAFAGMAPGVPGPQYNMYPTYPYMPPSAGYHHYVHNPYTPYPPTPGAAYTPQAGSSTFSPAVVSSQYPGAPQPQGGPVKFQHSMPQYKPAPASGGPQNTSQPAYGQSYSQSGGGGYAQPPASSAGTAYGSEDFGSAQMRGYKDSGLFIPGQQTGAQAGNSAAASGAPSSGLEGTAPSSYSYGGYPPAGQTGYTQSQYAQYAAQGQYWQNQMLVPQQPATTQAEGQ